MVNEKENKEVKQKSILFVVKKWAGGVGNMIKTYEKYLTRRGYKVYTLSREDDLQCYSLGSSFSKLRKAVSKRDYDYVITNDWSLALPLLVPYPINVKNHYCIFHGHPVSFLSSVCQGYIGWVLSTFGRLFVVGPTLEKKYKGSVRIDNGIDLEVFKKVKPMRERSRSSVGFVNWSTPFYHYEEAYDAVNGMGKEFYLAEGLKKKEMNSFYNDLMYLVSLPKSAGYNLAWVEAIACGVPFIIGNHEGIGDELPITKIDGVITKDKIIDAIKCSEPISDLERDNILKKVNAEISTTKLLEALNGEEEGEEDDGERRTFVRVVGEVPETETVPDKKAKKGSVSKG